MTVAIKVSKHKLYDMITRYHEKQKEIERLNKQLATINTKGTAQYGIEATLPKGGGIGNPTQAEALRRIMKAERIQEYVQDNLYIVERMHRITDERERIVLDCLLDGLSITATGKHLDLSRKHIHELRDRIVERLAD